MFESPRIFEGMVLANKAEAWVLDLVGLVILKNLF